MRLVDIEPLFDKYDKMNEGTEFSPIHFMNDLAALPVVESCEDCVSREETIRVAEQGQIQGYEWHFKKLCNLPAVKPQQKWIPVSERLPEEMGTYMTTVDYKEHGLATGQRYYHGQGLWEDDCVIAWMPLPESYKEDSNE